MATFPFNPKELGNYTDFITYQQVFYPHELKMIRSRWQEHQAAEAKVIGGDGTGVDEGFRKSEVQFLPSNNENQWIYQRIKQYVTACNAERYQFDLQGIFEDLQLARYREGHFFDWHLDFGVGPTSTRKLSMSVQLSDPATYDGGDLQFQIGSKAYTCPREEGAVVIFPSFITHRVTPVTRGERFSIVGWINGNPFR